MWQNSKRFYCSFPFLITTLVFVLFGTLSWFRLGTEATAYVGILFLAAVCIVAHEYNKWMDQRVTLESKLSQQRTDHTLYISHANNRGAYWFEKYLQLRMDRAAILKALTAVHPAGYRQEYYLIESPATFNDYGGSYDIQTFLYIDLPEELGFEYPQLRFAVTRAELMLIGDLPDYNKQRITLMESDSQATLQRYLAHEAYEQLKDNEDGQQVGSAAESAA